MIDLLLSLLLRVFSFCGGIAGFVGLYHGALWMLKVGTVIACLFCLRPVGVKAAGVKSWTVVLGSIAGLVANRFLPNPIEGLGWIIINGLFTLMAALTMLEIVGEFPWVSAIRNCGWTEKVFSLLLRIFSLCGGVAAFVGAYHGNLWMLKIGTVLAGLFCLRHADFGATLPMRFSRKIWNIILGILLAMLINCFLDDPVENLNWMIINGRFTFWAALSALSFVTDIAEDIRDWWREKREHSKT